MLKNFTITNTEIGYTILVKFEGYEFNVEVGKIDDETEIRDISLLILLPFYGVQKIPLEYNSNVYNLVYSYVSIHLDEVLENEN